MPDRTELYNLRLLDPERLDTPWGTVRIEDGRIAQVDRLPMPGSARADARSGDPRPEATSGEPSGAEHRIDLGGALLAPGFLDLHFHGELAFAEPERSHDAVRRDARRRLRHGTTGFLATTVTQPLAASLETLASLGGMTQAHDAARCLGIHLEGPWIQPRLAGAQPAASIREYAASEARLLIDAAAGTLRMVTLAPEIRGGLAATEDLRRAGIVVALGHSQAPSECVEAAVARGMTHVTHIFNAMTQLHHRDLGVVGCALTDPRLGCDLICDGLHVHPRIVALAARAKPDALSLITDQIALPGSAPPGDGTPGHATPRARDFGAGPVHLDGSALRLADGTLAGSCLELDQAVANFRRFTGASLLEAVRAATLRPAKVLGMEAECGSLRRGARADFAVLDGDGRVRETWLGGRRVYERLP